MVSQPRSSFSPAFSRALGRYLARSLVPASLPWLSLLDQARPYAIDFRSPRCRCATVLPVPALKPQPTDRPWPSFFASSVWLALALPRPRGSQLAAHFIFRSIDAAQPSDLCLSLDRIHLSVNGVGRAPRSRGSPSPRFRRRGTGPEKSRRGVLCNKQNRRPARK